MSEKVSKKKRPTSPEKKKSSKPKEERKKKEKPIEKGEIEKKSNHETMNDDSRFPLEVISGQLLTHYDETAGVAIPQTSVEQHRSMGNSVKPLTQSYTSRHDGLRKLLTSKLFPRREQLLQLRRQLLDTSTEVAAVRKGIERETMTDTEQIIERLRSVESMRQSAITHQVY